MSDVLVLSSSSDDEASANSRSSPQRKKAKRLECDLGERCFRVNKNHLKYVSHPHLDELLSSLPDRDPIVLPFDHQAKISLTTLKLQLQVLKDLKNGITPVTPVKLRQPLPVPDAGAASSPSSKECRFGKSCFRKHPEHFKEFEHAHLNRILRALGDVTPTADILQRFNFGVSWDTVKNQLEIVRKIKGLPAPQKGSDSASNSQPSVSVQQGNSRAGNAEAAEKYRVVVIDRVNHSIIDKMKAAAPYNLFLTTISDSPETHKELLSLTFSELLDPHLGDLESSLQINFMVQLGWMLAGYHIMGHRGKPLTLLYGEIDTEVPDNLKHFLKPVKITPPSPFGSHHTKMMVFAYKDRSIRVVVSTANLVESDWDNRTQGLWISRKCPPLPENSDSKAGESPTMFKMSLLRYLTAYKCPELVPWIMKISHSDMSKIGVFFVPSIPGSHTVNRQHWGQCCLSSILSENVDVPEKNTYPVIVQCSSIGSLGPKPESWLMGDMLRTFSSGRKSGLVSQPSLKFVYPSFRNIESSYDGLLGGGCLPYRQVMQDKQSWVTCFMCQWKSDKRHRTRAPPHIKSYCRVSPDNRRLSYFLLTSANLSKAAWGTLTKSGSLSCQSYEAGVLFLPQFMINSEYFPLTEEEKPHEDTPVFPLPYDLPLVPYDFGDVPWVMDHIL